MTLDNITKYIKSLTDIDGSEGFSCTYAKKKVYEVLENLIEFSKYDPTTAMDIADEMFENMNHARRVVYANASGYNT